MENEDDAELFRLIIEKSADKKKGVVKELELLILQNFQLNSEQTLMENVGKIKKLTDGSQVPAARRSGFLCYISLINILKQKRIENGTVILAIIRNIILCFKDNDPRIVCSAAECLYNIMKHFPNYVISFFNDIFEGLLLLNVNPDEEVRNIAQNLDSLLKEIINYSFQANLLPPEFNLLEFFQKIYEKINSRHPSIKKIIVSWIIFINSIPEIKLINVLHELLPSLFNMLSDKQVNESAENCLKDLYKEVDTFFDGIPYEVEVQILDILIEQCKSSHDQTKKTAFDWILLFLQRYKYFLIQKLKAPYTKSIPKSTVQVQATPKFPMSHTPKESVGSTFIFEPPVYEYSSKEETINYASSFVDSGERRIPFNLFPKILDIIISSCTHANTSIKKASYDSNNELIAIVDFYSETNTTNIKLFEEVLKSYLTEEKESVLELVFIWINKLFKKFHDDTFARIDTFMEGFTKILSHPDPKIFDGVLDIICEIAKYKDDYIEIIISKIMEKLSMDKVLLNDKGLQIVKKICSILQVDRVYSTFAEVLLKMKESDFAGRMINILDIFLLTFKEAESLRNLLKNVKKSANHNEKLFFEKLFRAWCINPVSSLILCLIAEYFELSYFLLVKFGELTFDQESYLELAQLVQLLESSVFINIRIYLLEPRKNNYLIKTLYGILLILPQGKAYQALFKRLKHMQMILKLETNKKEKQSSEYNTNEIMHYLNIFETVHKKVTDEKEIK